MKIKNLKWYVFTIARVVKEKSYISQGILLFTFRQSFDEEHYALSFY